MSCRPLSGYEQLQEEGRVEGARTIITRQLRRKFGALDGPTLERLASASIEGFHTWAGRVLEARSVAQVFGGP